MRADESLNSKLGAGFRITLSTGVSEFARIDGGEGSDRYPSHM